MLSPSQAFFLQCLSDFLNDKPTRSPDGPVNWQELFETAAAHSLAGLLFHRCKDLLPESDKRKQLKQYLGNLAISIKREKEVRKLASHFEEKGILAVFMKGSVFRDYYPIPPLRSMGDIDFIIRTADRQKADDILLNRMGYKRFIDNHAVWTYWKDSIFIEVHDHMFYENLSNKIDYRSYFDHVWEYCKNEPVFGTESDYLFIPEENFHFLYLMTHTAKHIINNGSGFRAYLDMVLMVKKCNLDWEWIERELKHLKLLTFTHICFELCERWFQVEMPLTNKSMNEAFYEKVTQKTFQDGAFGLGNQQNIGANAAKEIKRDGKTYLFGAGKLTLRKLFPPYEDLQLIPWYSWVDGRPWLVPAAWIYRVFYCAVKKRKHAEDLLFEPFTRKEEVKRRQLYLQSWGL